jgi:hypothetical protein
MIKNNNNLDSLSKSLLNDVRSVLEGKKGCDKECKCEKCEAEEKDEAEEKKEVKEAKKMKGEDPCWKGYEMIGTKKGKGGKEVPNCVPEEVEVKNEAYNKDAVDKAISSSRQKIGGREAKKIHALLKGSTGYKSKDVKEESQLEEGEEKGGGYNAPKSKGTTLTYKKVLGQHTVHKGNTFHRSFPTEIEAMNYVKNNQPKKTYSKVTAHPFHGMSEEVNEAKAESPIKGTRLISKHEGKDGHHAEVRHNSEYNEFQVHHYENGKHMGEGPVSYHDTKADAKETAEYEVKNYRPKGGSLQKEEVEVVDNEFNRANYKHLIGKTYPNSKAPSYARVKEVNKLAKEEVDQVDEDKVRVGTLAQRTQAYRDEKLVGNQHKIDKNKNGKLDKQDFKMLRKEKPIEEKLNPSMGSAKYIDDFVNSKDPRFEGKTKKERIKMALGAYYGAKNEAVEVDQIDEISSDLANRYVQKSAPDRGFGDEQKARLSQTKRDNRQRYGNVAREKIFAGKNKDKETSVRVAATNEEVENFDEGYGKKRDYAKHHIEVDGKYIATTTWARNAKEAEKRFLQAHPEHKGARITISKDS